MKLAICGSIFAVLLGALIASQQQTPCATCTNNENGRAVRWEVPIRTIPLNGEVLSLDLAGTGNSAWRLGAVVKPGAASTAKMQVAEIALDTAPRMGVPPLLKEVLSYGDREFSLAPGRAGVFLRGGSGSRKTVAYIELPRSTTLEVYADHQLVARAFVTESIHIADGKLLSDPVTGLVSLMMRSITGPSRPGAGVQKLGPNEFYAPPPELVKNLVQFSRPARYQAGTIPEGASASFLITVGADGEVKGIVGSRGDDKLVQHCRPVILGWRFNPMMFEGSAVTVKGSVLVTIDRQGNVVIPMIESR